MLQTYLLLALLIMLIIILCIFLVNWIMRDKKVIISEKNKPHKTYVSVVEWVRSPDPWHADAFPDEFKYAGSKGERKMGWLGLDWVGNPIIFIPDGTDEEEN